MTISSLGLLFDFCEARTPIIYLATHCNLHFSQAGDIADVGWVKRSATQHGSGQINLYFGDKFGGKQ